MAPRQTAKYVVAVTFDRTDPRTGRDTNYAVDKPYDGPDVDKYLDWGLIVPADAGSSQPGEQKDEESA